MSTPEDAAAAVAAAERALAEAKAALAAAQASSEPAAAPAPAEAAAPAEAVASAPAAASVGPLDEAQVEAIRSGYAFDGPALELGALVNGDPRVDVPVRIPLGMLNRHGLVAGATGTGKTKTLQVLAEQLSAAGVPVFAADIKGDLSGIASAGEPSEKLLERTRGIGQDWVPAASPVELYTLGGVGTGVPIRATVTSFGPLLLSKVLGLNATQESSLGLVFHYADKAGLPLVDLADLRSVLQYLTGDDGKAELKELGGISAATAGVILRELIAFAEQGADVFFGEPEFDGAELLRTAADGRGVVSLLELPDVQDRPALFSTFLMWLLADLFESLPEVGDPEKPKLVFFFDEAHLLFKDASKDFLSAITQTVRLIRSKGVGVVFVTQTPKDVPSDVLAQLGSRIQHQLRAHTPDDAKALKATVSTYPTSGYDLREVLTTLATGEAIVTVMNERGAPSPVAWTRLRAPLGSMSPTPAERLEALVGASPLLARYGTAFDPESAQEILQARVSAAEAAREAQAASAREEKERRAAEEELARRQREVDRLTRRPRTPSTRTRAPEKSPVEKVLTSRSGQALVREILRGVFGTLRKR